MVTDPGFILGVDIGGTKLAAGVVTAAGEVRSDERTATLAAEGPDAVIARLIDLCRRAVQSAGLAWSELAAVGVGCAGPLDPWRGIIQLPPNLPGWVDVPLVERLRAAFDRPVYLDNDANAAALGEHGFGAGRGVRHMVYLTISTGVGGGVILDGALYQGQNGNAGEIGHMSVAHDGRLCGCGSRGCLEAYASGTAIAARAREAVRAGEASSLVALAGSVDAITSGTVVTAATQGDALARRIWDETTRILGAGIANVINLFNPERVVLGGGVTEAGELLFQPVREVAFARAMRPLTEVVQIIPAQLGPRVGILGAAAVALAKHREA